MRETCAVHQPCRPAEFVLKIDIISFSFLFSFNLIRLVTALHKGIGYILFLSGLMY